MWAETSRRRRGAVADGAHPFGLTQRELLQLWGELSAHQLALAPLAQLPRMRASLALPSTAEAPLASLHSLLGETDAQTDEDWRLSRWRVEGLGLGPEHVASILPYLPEERFPQHHNVILGDDLRFWKTVGMFLVELLVRERYLPRFVPDPAVNDGRFHVVWRPFLDRHDTERARALAAAMPPAALADRSASGVVSAESGVEVFLTEALDALVRTHGRRSVSLDNAPKRRREREPNILRAALMEREAVTGIRPELVELRSKLDSWVSTLARVSGDMVATCFKLDPPPQPAEGVPPLPDVPWRLSFHLQAVDEPSVLLPASVIWVESGDEIHYQGQRFEAPQEKLLAGLGRAARIFSPLEASLAEATPSESLLPPAVAYYFLTEVAPTLQDAGFAVSVPDFSKTQLGVRLRLHPADEHAETAGTGGLGLGTIVRYDLAIALGDQTLPSDEIERLARLKVPLVQVGGEWTMLSRDDLNSALAISRGQSEGQIEVAQALRAALGGGELMSGLTVVGVEASGWLAGLVRTLSGDAKMEELQQPKHLKGELRPYQLRGLSWFAFLRRSGLAGCLADDMGLGKTVQVIAFLLSEAERGAALRPTLIVCPTSVVGNWQREIARFGPRLKVLVHHGSERMEGGAFAKSAAKHDVVLTTYSLLQRDIESLKQLTWQGVILDEAQNIKNSQAKQSQAARSIVSGFRAALTGTPVENRLSELWSIMEFLNPGFLGSESDFRQAFAIPIERYRQRDKSDRLRRIVGPLILRRLKSDPKVISDLPQKMEMKVLVNLTREQATMYETIVKDMLDKVDAADGIERKGLVLATLTRLKQVCNHPVQILKDDSELAGRSGKLARVTEMLEEALAEGDRALVFSQFKEMGDLLVSHLSLELGRDVLFLHGGVPPRSRQRMIDAFQSEDGPPIFVLSLKAGGIGLNLTRANHVFHFDRWWNPAVENQATDRAFRIGQLQNVQVHKFVCVGTLEERIDSMIESKKDLAELVVGAGESWLTELSTAELRDLVTLRSEALGADA